MSDAPGPLDLGGGHTLRWVEDKHGNPVGAIHEAPWPGNPDGSGKQTGMVWLDVPATHALVREDGRPRPMWRVVSWDPLTLEPSIRTTAPGAPEIHGFIREGRWIPA